jgi:hypothetical protein
MVDFQNLTDSEIEDFLSRVCESDKQKLQQKVIQDLQFYCNLTENEAINVWHEGTKHGFLVLINYWENDEKFKYYSYTGKTSQFQVKIEKDFTDVGGGRSYHNAPQPPEGIKKGGRYNINDSKKKSKRKAK